MNNAIDVDTLYLIQICNTLRIISIAVLTAALFAGIIITIYHGIHADDDFEKYYYSHKYKMIKKYIIIGIIAVVSLLGVIFIPTEDVIRYAATGEEPPSISEEITQ